MDPAQRHDLKRPRHGSLDTEADRPPPRPPGSTHRTQIGPDMQLTSSAEAQYRASPASSNRSHPTAVSYSMVPGSNLAPPSQTYITGGNHFESHGNFNFYHQSSPAGHDPCLKQLHDHAASNAIHTSSAVDNQGLCMPGTRAFTLQRLQSLVVSIGNDDPDVIWMHGPAGSGKSAIMRTVANALDEQGVLLGSFFFFRSDPQRNTSAAFIPTMAFQSFTSCPATQPHIRNAVLSHPNIFSQSIRHQLLRLLETPLKLAADHEPKWTPQSPLVIVIDGLDECADADRQIEVIQAMQQLASTVRSSTNRRIKVLIASRPEKPIKDEFEPEKDSVTIIELDPSDANIDLFYDTRLDDIRRRKNIPEPWPSPAQVKWLKEKTSGQYSFAHISTGFLAGGDPVERLKMIENGVGTHGLEPFAALDALYATIFQQVPPEMAENALLLVRIWLVYSQFADEYKTRLVERILSLPSGFSLRLLPYLSCIFHLTESRFFTPYFRPYHASLGDFLGDQLRASKYSLFLDLRALSTAIIEGMLGLCVVPLTLPIDQETADAWFQDYGCLLTFTNQLDEPHWNYIMPYFSPLPSTTAILDQLSLLLPTMDLYAFGYCARLLSVLFYEWPEECGLASSNPSFFHTGRRLLDQIHLIQQLRFAMCEALEGSGDSGLGLFGLLVVFASGFLNSLYPDTELEERSTQACRVEDVVAHLVHDLDIDIPDPEQSTEKPLPLRTLTLQLSTTKKLSGGHEIPSELFAPHSVGGFVLFSGPIEHKFPKLSLCLSQTIGMFLDLPSQKTQIQGRILQCIACAVHAKLCLQCDSCTANLRWMQISVIKAVLAFLCAADFCEIRAAVVDARTFVRCHHFIHAVYHLSIEKHWIERYMTKVGACILDKLVVETGTDTDVADDVRTIVSSLHEKEGMHSESRSDYRYSSFTTRDNCWVCSGVDLAKTDSAAATNSRN